VITPALIFDSAEWWMPVPVETIILAGAMLGEKPIMGLDELGGPVHSHDRIDFPKDMKPIGNDDPCGYHRVVDGGSLWWHQFWMFYLYNPKKYAGFGEHEGDWEMVQLGCRDPEGDVPILMTLSQHDGGEKREFWRCELDGDGSPKVFVARDSHANYPSVHRDVSDVADGKIGRIPVRWLDFGPWAAWPGTWGNSDNSPGPLMTRRAWQAPHAYHGQARG
jgi:hypothetical protein